jgi:hypothetical protein
MPSVMYDKPATGLLNWLRGNKRAYSHMGAGIFAWNEDLDDTEE